MRFKPNDPRLSKAAREQIGKAVAKPWSNMAIRGELKPGSSLVGQPEPFEGPRYRSKAEAHYAATLTAMSHDTESTVISFRYEAVKLYVGTQDGKSYWYTPDFCVECSDKIAREACHGKVVAFDDIPRTWIEYHEVKGKHRFREKGLVKFRAAQALYPFWKFVLVEA